MKRTTARSLEAQARRNMVVNDRFGRAIEFVSKLPHDQRTRDEYPYAYSPFYIWRDRSIPTGDYGLIGDDISANYDDRMRQWDGNKFADARDLTGRKSFSSFTRKEASEFLTFYFGEPVEALALAEGCNVSNGYPYWIFWHRRIPAEGAAP